jgi:predicted RecA/RadA family phage recombinase
MSAKLRDPLELVRTVKYTHSSATVTDTIYYLAGMVMLAMNSALANVANIFIIGGLIEYTKVSTEVWTAGQKIYWDDTNARFTNVRTVGLTLAGYAAEAAANPTTTGFIILDPALKAASNPAHSLIAAGLSAAENDADASVVITVAGVAATDVVTATVSAATAAVYVTKAICTADTITVTLSGNGGAGTVVNYQVSRAVI